MEHFPIYPAILLQIVGFFVLFWLLKTFFFGPIGHVINDRERIVRERLDDAEASRVKMNAAREDYEKRIEEAMKQANLTKDEMLATARTQADTYIEKGKADLEREREKVEHTLRDRI